MGIAHSPGCNCCSCGTLDVFLTAAGGNGAPVQGACTVELLSTQATSVTMTNQGTLYATVPTVVFPIPASGSDRATGHATIDGSGHVTGVVIDTPGSGYAFSGALSGITFSGGGGSGAIATFATTRVAVSTVTSSTADSVGFVVINNFNGMTSASGATVTLGAPVGGGTQATATIASISSPNVGFVITVGTKGTLYAAAPTVIVAGTTGGIPSATAILRQVCSLGIPKAGFYQTRVTSAPARFVSGTSTLSSALNLTCTHQTTTVSLATATGFVSDTGGNIPYPLPTVLYLTDNQGTRQFVYTAASALPLNSCVPISGLTVCGNTTGSAGCTSSGIDVPYATLFGSARNTGVAVIYGQGVDLRIAANWPSNTTVARCGGGAAMYGPGTCTITGLVFTGGYQCVGQTGSQSNFNFGVPSNYPLTGSGTFAATGIETITGNITNSPVGGTSWSLSE